MWRNSVRLVQPRKTQKRTLVRHGMGLAKEISCISAAKRPIQNVSTWKMDTSQQGVRRPHSCCIQCLAYAGFCDFRGFDLMKTVRTHLLALLAIPFVYRTINMI